MIAGFTESVLQFGEQGRLFGILATPSTINPARPVVLIPNTGFEHRVGPNRLHVQTARALAAAGFFVVRYDVSGLGDSDAPQGQAASSLADSQLLLDVLDRRQLGSGYMVIGLCSGSHDGHQLCRADERVVGLFSIDGYAYRNAKYHWLYWAGRLSHPLRSIKNVAGRVLPQYRLLEPRGADAEMIQWPNAVEVAADYQRFVQRRVSMAFVFTGDVHDTYLYADQHYDVFPMLRGASQLRFLSHIDHTLTRRAAREEMIRYIREWLLKVTP